MATEDSDLLGRIDRSLFSKRKARDRFFSRRIGGVEPTC
jgi:hypothetical protein